MDKNTDIFSNGKIKQAKAEPAQTAEDTAKAGTGDVAASAEPITMQSGAPEAKQPVLTLEYVLEHIDRIAEDTEHIYKTIDAIAEMQINESPNGGVSDASRAEAITAAVQCRETTNQKLLETYNKLLDSLLAPKPVDVSGNRRREYFAMVESVINDMCDDDSKLKALMKLADIAGPFKE